MYAYRRWIFRINARAVQQHAALVDERRILIIVVPDIHRKRSGGRKPFRHIPRSILRTNGLSCLPFLPPPFPPLPPILLVPPLPLINEASIAVAVTIR